MRGAHEFLQGSGRRDESTKTRQVLTDKESWQSGFQQRKDRDHFLERSRMRRAEQGSGEHYCCRTTSRARRLPGNRQKIRTCLASPDMENRTRQRKEILEVMGCWKSVFSCGLDRGANSLYRLWKSTVRLFVEEWKRMVTRHLQGTRGQRPWIQQIHRPLAGSLAATAAASQLLFAPTHNPDHLEHSRQLTPQTRC